MSLLLTVMFVGVLAAAIFSFARMGIRQFRRSRTLARKAYDLGLHFTQSDLFDVGRRYADFALISRGHSGRASYITYGRIEGASVRAFDFCNEMGHGTQRVMRSDGAVVIETRMQLPSLLMWDEKELSFAPMAVRGSDERIGNWLCSGDMALAAALAPELPEMGSGSIIVQASGSSLMLIAQPQARPGEYILNFEEIGKITRCLAKWIALNTPQGC